MSAVKSAVLTLSVTFCFLGVTMLLSPKGNIEKSFKSFVSICIVTILIVSVLNVSGGLQSIDFQNVNETSIKSNQKLNDMLLNQQQLSVETAVKSVIYDSLKQNGITECQISVTSDISDSNDIYITDVILKCPEGQLLKCREVLDSLSILGKVEEIKNGN